MEMANLRRVICYGSLSLAERLVSALRAAEKATGTGAPAVPARSIADWATEHLPRVPGLPQLLRARDGSRSKGQPETVHGTESRESLDFTSSATIAKMGKQPLARFK